MKIAPLGPGAITRSLIAKLSRPGGVVDSARQIATNLGARPFRVFLVWSVWSGAKRGEGTQSILRRHELLPTPYADFGAITRVPALVGVYPAGTARVTEVPPHLTLDELTGRVLPGGGPLPPDARVDFFYEVVEDRRGDDPPDRPRYRLGNVPSYEAENVQWVLMLERVSGDMNRNGQPLKALAK